MDADQRGYTASKATRLRLGTLLVLFPLLALIAVLFVWVALLRSQIETLEQRVSNLEVARPYAVIGPVSNVGVPNNVDRAMLMDGMRGNPQMPMMKPRY